MRRTPSFEEQLSEAIDQSFINMRRMESLTPQSGFQSDVFGSKTPSEDDFDRAVRAYKNAADELKQLTQQKSAAPTGTKREMSSVLVDDETSTNGGSDWPSEEPTSSWNGIEFEDHPDYSEASTPNSRWQILQSGTEVCTERLRLDAERQRQVEAERRRVFLQKRDTQSEAIRALIRTDTLSIDPSPPRALMSLLAQDNLPPWTAPRTNGIEPVTHVGHAILDALGKLPPLPVPVKDGAAWASEQVAQTAVEMSVSRVSAAAGKLFSRAFIALDLVMPSRDLADGTSEGVRSDVRDAIRAREAVVDLLANAPLPATLGKPSDTHHRPNSGVR